MAHRLAPQAQADLSTIWIYIVNASGNVVAADGVVDAITERFYLLSQYPRMGRPHDDLRPYRDQPFGYVFIWSLAPPGIIQNLCG